MNNQPTILVSEHFEKKILEKISKNSLVIDASNNQEKFNAYLKKANGLLIRTGTTVNKNLLNKMPNLIVIGRAGVGLDHIDLKECEKRNIIVVHTPTANSSSVAEFVVGKLFKRSFTE